MRRAQRHHWTDSRPRLFRHPRYAQELVPGKVGTMSGLFFGLGGIGSAILGAMADRHGISYVFHVCSYLPLIGLLTALLPNLSAPKSEKVPRF